MKPHPRIRKTIKWGGAAVTVLLVVVWIGSGRLFRGYNFSGISLSVSAGQFSIIGSDQVPASGWWDGSSSHLGLIWSSHLRIRTPTEWSCALPIYWAAAATLAVACIAWRLDAIARRRAGLNLCPKCNYDLAGIGGGAGDAVCPECGSGGPSRG